MSGLRIVIPNYRPPTVTHQAKQVIQMGDVYSIGDTPRLTAAIRLLRRVLLEHATPPGTPLAGPLSVRMDWTWPWLETHSRRLRLSQPRIPKTTRPDLTNLAKTLEDRLVELQFIKDDALIANTNLWKWWGHEPGIAITVRPFSPYTREEDRS